MEGIRPRGGLFTALVTLTAMLTGKEYTPDVPVRQHLRASATMGGIPRRSQRQRRRDWRREQHR